MKVKFIREFEWRVHARRHIVFRAGAELQVTRACGAAAIKAGAAIKADTKANTSTKGQDDDESTDAAGPQPDPVSGGG